MDKIKTVIIIDDSEIDTFISKSIIENLNIVPNIKTFPNAVEGLEYFKLIGLYT